MVKQKVEFERKFNTIQEAKNAVECGKDLDFATTLWLDGIWFNEDTQKRINADSTLPQIHRLGNKYVYAQENGKEELTKFSFVERSLDPSKISVCFLGTTDR